MPSNVDCSRLPWARATTSYTSREITPISSRIARVGSSPSRRLGSAGRHTNDAPRSGTISRSRNTCTRRDRSSDNSTIRAAAENTIPACRSSVAATTTDAPSSPSIRSKRPSAATNVDLPCPLGIIQPARRGRGYGSRTEATNSTCQPRSRIGFRAPAPFGTITNRSQNRANRAAPTERGRNGSTDGSTAAFGPAFTLRRRHRGPRCVTDLAPGPGGPQPARAGSLPGSGPGQRRGCRGRSAPRRHGGTGRASGDGRTGGRRWCRSRCRTAALAGLVPRACPSSTCSRGRGRRTWRRGWSARRPVRSRCSASP